MKLKQLFTVGLLSMTMTLGCLGTYVNATTGAFATTLGQHRPAVTPSASSLVRESMALAKTGHVINIPFTGGSSDIQTVEGAWGQPTHQNYAGAGVYASYVRQGAAFGFNKGSLIFDVRSFARNLQHIRLSDVLHVLGAPGETRYYGSQEIFMYPAGAKFQLLWVFAGTKHESVDPFVDHISVFSPEDTVNSMAQNVTPPRIVIRHSPGSVGSLFTFALPASTSGYRLTELEWIATDGRTVVNTYHQAILSRQRGGHAPNFQTVGPGRSIGFDYLPAMRGERGSVVAIYQATSGEAIISNSSPLTLK